MLKKGHRQKRNKKIESKKINNENINEIGTDSWIKKYKIDITTSINNESQTQHHEIDITEKELHKFLLIFNLLIESHKNKDSGEVTDAEDCIADILVLIATKIFELLQENIDSLDIPIIFKKASKKLKDLVFKQQKNAEKEIHSSNQETLFVEGESSMFCSNLAQNCCLYPFHKQKHKF